MQNKATVSCPNCSHKFVPEKEDLRKLDKQAFIDEILKSDENCFRYTGVPLHCMQYTIELTQQLNLLNCCMVIKYVIRNDDEHCGVESIGGSRGRRVCAYVFAEKYASEVGPPNGSAPSPTGNPGSATDGHSIYYLSYVT